MKQFGGNRPTQDIIDACKANNWTIHTDRYKEGGDYITFHFVFEDVTGCCIYNTFNGSFFGELINGRKFNSNQADLDSAPWFSALLDFVYLPKNEAS